MQTVETKKSNGFTLVELIIVIGILAVLAVIAVPNVSGYLEQGRRKKAITDATQLAKAINIYNLTSPPLSEDDLNASLEGVLSAKSLLPKLSAKFVDVLPNVAFFSDTGLYAVTEGALDLSGY